MNTETLAVGTVMKAISRTDRLVPFLNANDKEPVWDGYVAVYGTPKAPHTIQDLLLRIHVQIKGQKGAADKDTISYSVKLADLRQYSKENPTVFFVVRLEGERETIYHHVFTKGHAEEIVQRNSEQDTVSLSFQRFPTAKEEKEKLFLNLAGGKTPEFSAKSSLVPAPLSDTDVFLYNAGIVGFFGREKETARLDAFLTSPGAFRWWGVIGPGGAGKSRLGLEWGKKAENQGWTVKQLKSGDYKRLDELTKEHPEPLLLIADYARQHAAALGAWMETLCETERESPLRLLLLERDEGADAVGETSWEKELYNAGNEVHLRAVRHERLLSLPALEDAPLRELILAFAGALRKRDESLPELTKSEADTLLRKLGEIDADLRRPLYAMVLTDAYLRDPAAAHWTREALLDRLVTREREQVKNAMRALQPENVRLDQILLDAALRLRRLATALGASGDRELAELLALDEKLGETFAKKAEQYNIPSVEELLLYLGLLRYVGGKLLVPALRPDLLGEYALLHWLTDKSTRESEKAGFYAAALQDRELCTFFQRVFADYAPLLNAASERWERLLPRLDGLDEECASRYSFLLYDGFERCTDQQQRGRMLEETVRSANRMEAETPAAASIFNDLGLIYKSMGDYPRALELYQKTLAIAEKVYGTEHPITATDYNNLGLLYYAMGDYPRALEQLKKALVIREKVYGEQHPDTATSYNSLGEVSRAIRDYPRALEYHQKALNIKENVNGEAHPSNARSYNNLGVVYFETGDYTRALELYQKALAIFEKVYGAEHPDTATSYSNLGGMYYAMEDYTRALELYQKALAIYEKVYGAEHPETAICYNNLGNVYQAMGDYSKALFYTGKALVIIENVLGADHPSTKSIRANHMFLQIVVAIAEAICGSLPPELAALLRPPKESENDAADIQ